MGLVILTPNTMTDIEEIAEVVAPSIKGINKPVVSSFMGVKDVAAGVEILSKGGVPNYAFPEDAVKSLAAAYRLTSLREIPDRIDLEIDGLEVEKPRKLLPRRSVTRKKKYISARPIADRCSNATVCRFSKARLSPPPPTRPRLPKIGVSRSS